MIMIKMLIQTLTLSIVSVAIFLGYQTVEFDRVEISRHPDGSIFREIHYDRSGRLHGRYLEYFSDGTISQESVFTHGVWSQVTHYDNQGRKIHEMIVGEPEKFWDENGVEHGLR